MMIHTHIPKSKKRKLTAKQRELRSAWDSLVETHSKPLFGSKKATKLIATTQKSDNYTPSKPFRREFPDIPSRDTGFIGGTKPIEGKRYTGSAIIGIGTLHKSNAVPIFSQEEAEDQAKMRR